MIHAFVQRLRCGDHLIVRAGPLAKAYGDLYECAFIGEISETSVSLSGFVGRMTKPLADAVLERCFADGFKCVTLDRLGNNPRQLVFTKGEDGAIRMSKVKKEKVHPISELFKSDGRVNVLAAMAGLTHALGQDAAGHISITNGVATETPVPGQDAVDIVIKFRRNHH